MVSDSLTLCSKGREGDSAIGLPPAVVRCPDVAAAIKAGDVEVLKLDATQTKKQSEDLKKVAAQVKKHQEAREKAAKAKMERRMAAPEKNPPKKKTRRAAVAAPAPKED